MGVLRDYSRFMQLAAVLGLGYVLLVFAGERLEDHLVAIATFVLGTVAVMIIAYHFREDFQREE